MSVVVSVPQSLNLRFQRCGLGVVAAVLVFFQLVLWSPARLQYSPWDASSSIAVVNHTERSGDGDKREKSVEKVARNQEEPATATACQPVPLNQNYTGKPLFIPSYPGSGSELMLSLIRAISGNGGGNIYTDMGRYQNATSVTVKTHWPMLFPRMGRYKPSKLMDQYSNRYAILVRNPMNALPSHFNYRYERRNKLDDHSTQSPESAWILFRDTLFAGQVDKWKSMFTGWREQERVTKYYERAMILEYEAVTASAEPLVRLAEELRRQNCTTVVSDDQIRCLWYQVARAKTSKTRREPRKYTPSYTTKQKEGFLSMLKELKQDAIQYDDREVADLADRYLQDIQQNIRIVDESSV